MELKNLHPAENGKAEDDDIRYLVKAYSGVGSKKGRCLIIVCDKLSHRYILKINTIDDKEHRVKHFEKIQSYYGKKKCKYVEGRLNPEQI